MSISRKSWTHTINSLAYFRVYERHGENLLPDVWRSDSLPRSLVGRGDDVVVAGRCFDIDGVARVSRVRLRPAPR